jgi:hypothetical protein
MIIAVVVKLWIYCTSAASPDTTMPCFEEKMEETRQLLERQLAETKASRSELREELRRPIPRHFN